jgi:hypothetical protein
MPPTTLRMFFADRQETWTETYYRMSASLEESMAALKVLAQARVPMLAQDVTLTSLRVVTDPPRGNVINDGVSPNSSSNYDEQIDECVEVTLNAQLVAGGQVYHAARSIRGLPGSLTAGSEGVVSAFDPAGLQALRSWLSILVSQQICIRSANNQVPWTPIAGVGPYALQDSDVAGDPLDGEEIPPESAMILISTLTDAGIPAVDPITGHPSRLQIRGVKWTLDTPASRQAINGRHQVRATLPSAVVIQGQLPEDGQLLVAGFLRPMGIVYPRVVSSTVKGVGTRRTGGRTKYTRVVQPTTLGQATPIMLPAAPSLPSVPLPPRQPASGPGTGIYSNAQDVYEEIRLGYAPPVMGVKYPIGIAQALNYTNTWVVFLSGTDLTVNQNTGISEDILAAIGLPDLFTDKVVATITTNVQSGANLLLCGHSLGGMVAQNAAIRLYFAGYHPSWITTYGAPVTQLSPILVRTQRWMLDGDLVPDASPVGLAMAPIGHPEQTHFFEPDIADNAVDAHLNYFLCHGLLSWDAFGFYSPGGVPDVLITGPVGRFPSK